MTTTISFLTTADIPGKTLASVSTIPGASQEEGGAETAGEGAFDGFAALLDQLVQIVPAPATLPVAGAEGKDAPDDLAFADRQTGNPTGKILPVAGSDIAGLGAIGLTPSLGLVANPAEIVLQPSSTAFADARLPGAAALVTQSTLRQFTPAGLDMAVEADRASTPSTPFPALTATVASPVAMPSLMSVSGSFDRPAATVAIPGDSSAQAASNPTAITAITAIRLGPSGADRMVSFDPVNLPERDPAAVATKSASVPVDEAVRRLASAQTAATVSAPLPAKPADAAMPALIAIAPAVAPAAPRRSAPTLVTVQMDGATEAKAEAVSARPVEPVQATARLSLVADNVKPVEIAGSSASASAVANPTPLVAPLAATAVAATDTVTRAADLARPDAFAAIDSITRLVDRLSAVRDFGAAAATSFSVTHKEFGELAIAIDRVSDALEVAITAKDGEAQRALAAAMASERAAPRAFEALQQAASQNSLANAERGAANAQSNANAGASFNASANANANGETNDNSQGDAQRQQRARAQDAAMRGAHPAARDQADDTGLYA